jgi:hypothetical protein
MTVNSPLDAGRVSLPSATRWIGLLVLVHAIWGVARIPGKVVMRRVGDVRDYQQEGAAHYFFSKARLVGADAIAWLRENTPEQSVVLFDGPRLGAMEFPPALLAPRLFVSIRHCDPASESFAGRPIARGEIGGRRGTVVVHADRGSLRIEVR